MNASGRNKRRWLIVFAATAVLLAGWLWWRAGKIEVQVDEAALRSLQHAAVEAASSPLSPSPDGVAEFTVLTYNVQARPWFDDSRHKFKYISPLLDAYDICAVQECFKDHYRLWGAANHPVKVYHATLKHPFKIVGSGLSILGKFPVIGTDGINYQASGDQQNWPASKGLLLVRFDVRGMPLDVYTTHIAAGKKPASLAARVSQSNEIIEFIRKQSGPDHSVILMGDFNMRPSRGPEDKAANKDNPKVYAFDHLVAELGLRDASDEVNGPTGEEIDRVLFRAGHGCVMTALSWQRDAPEFYDPDHEPLSDHEPVFVRFRLARE